MNYSHLPSWLENNKLFRIIFLLRKLFLTRKKAYHYSQFAEDISIAHLLDLRNSKTKGFFVDVGCFHPKKYSNTWNLYRRGWRGINIDIDPIKIDGFNLIRPRDTNIACAVSNTEGETTYYSNGFYSLTISLDKDFTTGRPGYIEKKTTCKKLTTIIDETKYINKEIDFLSVDAEAHDLEVLRSLDFDRYQPKLIAIESHYSLLSEVIETELYKFLLDKNYCLVGWNGLSLLLANPQLQEELRNNPEKLKRKKSKSI